MGIRDRIIDFRRVRASELKRNPLNWRLHPDGQRSALGAMLDDVGFVGAAIARETDEGLVLIDGHLRADMAEDAEIPVIITDLSEDEAKRVILTYDPLGTLNEIDAKALETLFTDMPVPDNAELRKLMADLCEGLANDEKQGKSDEHDVPGMALQPHEHYDYLVVLATDTHQWNTLLDRLKLKPELRRGRMGTCRAIRASVLLRVLDNGHAA